MSGCTSIVLITAHKLVNVTAMIERITIVFADLLLRVRRRQQAWTRRRQLTVLQREVDNLQRLLSSDG